MELPPSIGVLPLNCRTPTTFRLVSDTAAWKGDSPHRCLSPIFIQFFYERLHLNAPPGRAGFFTTLTTTLIYELLPLLPR